MLEKGLESAYLGNLEIGEVKGIKNNGEAEDVRD